MAGGHQGLQRLDSNYPTGVPGGARRRNDGVSDDARTRGEPVSAPEVSQTDPITEALERALAQAVAAKDWPRARAFADALEARRAALQAPNVLRLPSPARGGDRR
jgi:hypothetical protein